MNNNSEQERIVRQLRDFYSQNNWVTYNFKDKVLSLPASDVMHNVKGHTHSIAELVAHMMAWRNFVLQKLTGNDEFDIEDNSKDDWPPVTDWEKLKKEFHEDHYALLDAIESFPSSKLDATVPLRNYSFRYLINGILEHDFYHSGQIGSVIAEINRKS